MKTKRTSNIPFQRRILSAKPQTVCHLNHAAVLDLIRQHQPLSPVDLARLTGIHRSNISIIVEDLQRSGMLWKELSRGEGRGHVPTLISLEREEFAVLGVNLAAHP